MSTFFLRLTSSILQPYLFLTPIFFLSFLIFFFFRSQVVYLTFLSRSPSVAQLLGIALRLGATCNIFSTPFFFVDTCFPFSNSTLSSSLHLHDQYEFCLWHNISSLLLQNSFFAVFLPNVTFFAAPDAFIVFPWSTLHSLACSSINFFYRILWFVFHLFRRTGSLFSYRALLFSPPLGFASAHLRWYLSYFIFPSFLFLTLLDLPFLLFTNFFFRTGVGCHVPL